MKYPAVYVYKRTSDKGQELKYSIRSLENVKNWNGEVFVCGDRESWFSDEIKLIDTFVRSHIKHKDVGNKRMAIVKDKRVPDDFIYMNDDFICISPVEIKPLHQGEMPHDSGTNHWQKMKRKTKAYLIEQGIENPLDYDIHVPIILNKQNILDLREKVGERSEKDQMCFRTLYGNIFKIGGKHYKDRKTQTSKLLKGDLLSTRIFAPELKKLFPKPSKFERI